ncbi:MAG: HEPN domain-containing protein [Planctomycetota bacterium]|jgi:HEPN domain-containing protein
MSNQHEQARLFLQKAVSDEALLDEVLTSRQVNDEIIGFHCQQAAEKLLKALLSHLGVDFPRTHNLRYLMDLLADFGHTVPSELNDLDLLTPFGTLFRYEDIPSQTKLDRETARNMIRTLRTHVEKYV